LLAGKAGLSGFDEAASTGKALHEVPIRPTLPGTADDLAQVHSRLEIAEAQAIRDVRSTNAYLFESPRLQGTRLTNRFKELIRGDTCLDDRVIYQSRGIDVLYRFGPQKWELTTFRAVERHILRFTTTTGLDGAGRLATDADLLDITWLLY